MEKKKTQEILKITATGKKVIQHFIFFVPPAKKDRVGLELKDKKKIQKSRKTAERQA